MSIPQIVFACIGAFMGLSSLLLTAVLFFYGREASQMSQKVDSLRNEMNAELRAASAVATARHNELTTLINGVKSDTNHHITRLEHIEKLARKETS